MRGVPRWRRTAAVVGGLAATLGIVATVPPGSQAGARVTGTAARRGSAAAATQVALHVIPFPGTPDASSRSEIIFQSLPARDLRSVTVLGSRSGSHAGHRTQLPDPFGTAFTPTQPFDPGELVTVKAALQSGQAGGLLGDPGATAVSFSFRVGVGDLGAEASREADRPSRGPTQSFHSAPSLHPPVVKVSADPDTRSGDVLLTPGDNSQSGLMILNAHGELVWFHRVAKVGTADLQVQRYRGHPVLTWWQGLDVWGQDEIVNRSYRPVATVRGAEGYLPDVHEFQITPRGTALIDAYAPVQSNLTSVGGSGKGAVWDCVIQEVDIRTGQLLWEWHALGHVPVSASHVGKPNGSGPYDFFHLNSIQQLPGGNLVVSARNTWAVYEVSRATGRVIWSLGGKHSSFRMAAGARFEWQHDARLQHHTLSLFDDADSPQEEAQSSAKVLRIDPTTMTATLLERYTHSPPLLSPAAGSAQVLPNHDIFVGWGNEPDFSEYTPGGRQIFSGTFPLALRSYRAFRSPWSGQPRTPPALALTTTRRGKVWAYVSWNGATQVVAWRLNGGPTPRRLRPLGRWPVSGFETAIRLSGRPRYIKAQALDAEGMPLGSSPVRPSG